MATDTSDMRVGNGETRHAVHINFICPELMEK